MTAPVAPLTLAQDLAGRLSKITPRSDAVARAKRFVRMRRDKRGEPLGRKGHEYVVEALLRPPITRWATAALGIRNGDDVVQCVYSSHYHTTADAEKVWEQRWGAFEQLHPRVNTSDGSHRRRADLFIATAADELVSFEFKYVRERRTPGVAACVKQVRQHLSKHRASILVVYAARKTSRRLQAKIHDIRREVQPNGGFVVAVVGPAIEFP